MNLCEFWHAENDSMVCIKFVGIALPSRLDLLPTLRHGVATGCNDLIK